MTEYLAFRPHRTPVCVYVLLCISACHFGRLNRCICLLTFGAYCSLFLQTLGGALAVALRVCVNQAALQTASRAPHRVGSCSSPVSSCQSKFLLSLPLFVPQSLNPHHHLLKSPLRDMLNNAKESFR